jgi:hypothetical protein
MVRLNYSAASVLEDTWKFIERGETVEIVLVGRQAKVVQKAFPHYLDNLAPERSSLQRRLSLVNSYSLAHFVRRPSGQSVTVHSKPGCP